MYAEAASAVRRTSSSTSALVTSCCTRSGEQAVVKIRWRPCVHGMEAWVRSRRSRNGDRTQVATGMRLRRRCSTASYSTISSIDCSKLAGYLELQYLSGRWSQSHADQAATGHPHLRPRVDQASWLWSQHARDRRCGRPEVHLGCFPSADDPGAEGVFDPWCQDAAHGCRETASSSSGSGAMGRGWRGSGGPQLTGHDWCADV